MHAMRENLTTGGVLSLFCLKANTKIQWVSDIFGLDKGWRLKWKMSGRIVTRVLASVFNCDYCSF